MAEVKRLSDSDESSLNEIDIQYDDDSDYDLSEQNLNQTRAIL